MSCDLLLDALYAVASDFASSRLTNIMQAMRVALSLFVGWFKAVSQTKV
jgi:hypothetical protein